MGKPKLHLDWCSRDAALYAARHWHYSGSLPAGKSNYVGVWENGSFIGAVVFTIGANRNMYSIYGLSQFDGVELGRMALRSHKTPVSRIMSISVKMVAAANPGLKLCVSFADPAQGHHGGIYQAAGWVYTGTSDPSRCAVENGRKVHKRTIDSRRSGGSAKDQIWVRVPGKHRYVKVFDDAVSAAVNAMRKPYPKRVGSADSGTPDYQSGRGGANPTPTLSSGRSGE